MFPDEVLKVAQGLADDCLQQQVRLAFAESCTAGLISAAMTVLPGASQIVDRGFVVYSNEAKSELLDVSPDLIEQHGAVSEEVAIAMGQGTLQQSHRRAQLGIAVTGIAGPGGTAAKPEGLVHVAVAHLDDERVWHQRNEFGAIGRDQVRTATIVAALNLARICLKDRQAN